MAAKRTRARKSAKPLRKSGTRRAGARPAKRRTRKGAGTRSVASKGNASRPTTSNRSWYRPVRSTDAFPLQGKAVLITGAARRVGAAIARTLQAAGANVMIHYRSSDAEANALAHELNTLRGGSVALVSGDLLEIKKLNKFVDATIKTFGQLDVLINNASTFY